jgi:hypothetical protein
MKNSNTSNWSINLMLVILTAAAMFLIAITFTDAKREGQQMRSKQEQYH